MKKILIFVFLFLSGFVSVGHAEALKWQKIQFSDDSQWIIYEDSKIETYLNLKEVYKLTRIKSSPHEVLMFFKGADQPVRITVGNGYSAKRYSVLRGHISRAKE